LDALHGSKMCAEVGAPPSFRLLPPEDMGQRSQDCSAEQCNVGLQLAGSCCFLCPSMFHQKIVKDVQNYFHQQVGLIFAFRQKLDSSLILSLSLSSFEKREAKH
jgi:hypothetical protein